MQTVSLHITNQTLQSLTVPQMFVLCFFIKLFLQVLYIYIIRYLCPHHCPWDQCTVLSESCRMSFSPPDGAVCLCWRDSYAFLWRENTIRQNIKKTYKYRCLNYQTILWPLWLLKILILWQVGCCRASRTDSWTKLWLTNVDVMLCGLMLFLQLEDSCFHIFIWAMQLIHRFMWSGTCFFCFCLCWCCGAPVFIYICSTAVALWFEMQRMNNFWNVALLS